jgi:glycosidase
MTLMLAACGDDGPADPCDGDPCGDHGTCSVVAGVATCDCAAGYDGLRCEDCATGYHPEAGACVEDADPFFGTPTVDGVIAETAGDWTGDQQVGENPVTSDWGANQMTALYAAYDDTYLYVAVKGYVEAANALVVYLDLDYGATSQGTAISATTDVSGALDNAVSADLTVTDASFRADWALGTRGMASVSGAVADEAGWRQISLHPADFAWITGDVATGADGFEARIALVDLFGGPAPAGRQVGLFARLTNEDGQYLANATLPADDPTQPRTVSQVAVITLSGSAAACDHDGTCDPGESTASCPDDCPATACDHDGTCDPDESTASCPDDCPAGQACGDPEAFQWEDAVMYFLMTDRFFDSDGQSDPVTGVPDPAANYAGGDWIGAQAKLTYLQNLGVNAIWLSAPYENRNLAGAAIDPVSDSHQYSGYHGYWPSPADIDYSDPQQPSPRPQVESRLGTAIELVNLISAMRSSGMKVLFDYVMKHVDAESGLHQAHPDWFVKDGNGNVVLCAPNLWDDAYWGTRCGFTSYLPPFDFYNPEVVAWSVNDALWWAREYGIDGYRLDAIKHVPLAWLTSLRTAIHAAFPDPVGGRFYLVGETYAYDDRDLIKGFVNPDTMLDGQFDFPLRKRLCDAVLTRSLGLDGLFSYWDSNDGFYGADALMTSWIGNHDIPRAIHFAAGKITDCYQGSNVGNGWNPGEHTQPQDAAPYERLGLAYGLMFTNRGIPLVYYGDEIGLAGGGDPDNRRPMQWDGLSAHQTALLGLVSDLARIRRENVALRRGHRVTVQAGTDTFAYRLTGCGAGQDVHVLVNRSDAAAAVGGLPAGQFTELLTSTSVGGGSPQEIPARSLRIYREN